MDQDRFRFADDMVARLCEKVHPLAPLDVAIAAYTKECDALSDAQNRLLTVYLEMDYVTQREPPLLACVRRRHVALVQVLVHDGANVAIRFGRVNVYSILLDLIENPEINHSDQTQETIRFILRKWASYEWLVLARQYTDINLLRSPESRQEMINNPIERASDEDIRQLERLASNEDTYPKNIDLKSMSYIIGYARKYPMRADDNASEDQRALWRYLQRQLDISDRVYSPKNCSIESKDSK